MSAPALTYQRTVVLELHECKSCGVPFGLSEAFESARRDDHRTWYCPNGHAWMFSAKSDLEVWKSRAQSAEATSTHYRDQLEATERSRAALKGHLTRLRKRIANGVCPWCDRHFDNVMRHVANKHPEHVEKAREATA